MSPDTVRAVRRIGRLADDEAEVRAEARRLELNPGRVDEARRLFGLASRLRAERLELLNKAGWL